MASSADGRLTRRQVLISGAVAAGYALAAGPVRADAIVTSDEGLVAGSVRVPAGDVEIGAYRAHPATPGPFPVVLVAHEIFGVHAYISDVVRRLARSGYFAIAPDLYQRQGDPTKLTSVDEIVSGVVAKVPDAQVMSDLDATLAFAGASGQGDVARSAITGFCWGGRIVWLYCAHAPKLRCGVAWYGRLVGDPRPETPKHPIDVAATESVPVLGLYGADDTGIPQSSVLAMRSTLATGKSGSQIVVFPAAPHGFHADYRDSYRPMAASEGWKRMLGWFREHGVV
ncbi:MAG TPA: dienelactone hydrolase family protein [Myxococcota bacterium]